MSLPPNSITPRAFESDLESQYVRLRMLIQATAVSVLILTGTVFVFLYRQVVLVRRQTTELTRYANEVDRPGMVAFVEQVHTKFKEFRKTHPDFNPIYSRYWTNDPVSTGRVAEPPARTTNAVSKPAAPR